MDKLEMELRAQHPDEFKVAPGGKGCVVVAAVLAAILFASAVAFVC